MKELYDDLCQSRLNKVMQNESCDRIFMLYNTYFDVKWSNSIILDVLYSPWFPRVLWNGESPWIWKNNPRPWKVLDFCKKMNILLGLIRASREPQGGNWQLHLNAIHCMIHLCFAYDRHNYACYLPIYYAQMTSLPKDHPSSYQQGGLSVQRSEHNLFGEVPIDQTIEETGGTEGFSLKPATLTKYYINAEYRSTCVRQLRSIIDQLLWWYFEEN